MSVANPKPARLIDSPPAPLRGMRFWVQSPGSRVLGSDHRVSRVNGRSFYIATSGRTVRYLLSEWTQWLAARHAEGRVLLDGQELRAPTLPGNGGNEKMQTIRLTVDVRARDARFLRAARDVVKRYAFDRQTAADGSVKVRVTGGDRPYVVTARLDWSERPACTCPDAERRRREDGAMCKHMMAVLMTHEDLRGQLLDILL